MQYFICAKNELFTRVLSLLPLFTHLLTHPHAVLSRDLEHLWNKALNFGRYSVVDLPQATASLRAITLLDSSLPSLHSIDLPDGPYEGIEDVEEAPNVLENLQMTETQKEDIHNQSTDLFVPARALRSDAHREGSESTSVVVEEEENEQTIQRSVRPEISDHSSDASGVDHTELDRLMLGIDSDDQLLSDEPVPEELGGLERRRESAEPVLPLEDFEEPPQPLDILHSENIAPDSEMGAPEALQLLPLEPLPAKTNSPSLNVEDDLIMLSHNTLKRWVEGYSLLISPQRFLLVTNHNSVFVRFLSFFPHRSHVINAF